ncbi:hypothetical protein [Halorubrum aidingense]|uniref:hypothetical protein n=1 Tax=Halorubrum aidingense TaxID=368623 RepID=UPI0006780C74|nr:hypothetical protein [Halorubrum aidingense]
MQDDSLGGRIGFAVDGTTLRVRDALEGEELLLYADREPDPRPALPELFPFPVDRAVSFDAESLSIPAYASVSVREVGGEFVAQLDDPMELPRGSYCVDVNGVTKVLIRVTDVEMETTGAAGSGPVELRFDRPRTVTVGARSLHSRPEATITVPDDPTALASAVSVLGSSIKEFSPERSWPTLRGYPPRIERGSALDIPSPLVEPDTGVEVVVRPTYADVYRLSTLAYYLGARMVTGNAPAIRLDTGYVESLPTDGVALEERSEALLRTWFFLDTLARTEGYVPSDRYEYEQVGPELPFYPPNLADRPMSERLMEYLEVDPETVAPYMPDWPTKAVLRPVPEAAELLPHLAHVLAPVRVRGSADPAVDAPVALATSPRFAPERGVPNPDDDPLPAGTSVLTPTAYENRLRRATTSRGEVRVVAIVDAAERAAALRRALSQPAVPGGVGSWDVLERPDSETVESVLSDPDVDIAYCELPIDGGRVVAADGFVSIDGLDNAPEMVVFAGTDDIEIARSAVANSGLSAAVAGGIQPPVQIRGLVGLLAAGMPVAASLSLSEYSEQTAVRLVGDPGTTLASNNGMAVTVGTVRSRTPDEHQFEYESVLSLSVPMGYEYTLLFPRDNRHSELIGRTQVDGSVLNSAQVVELSEQSDSILRLNGSFVFRNDGLTEAQVEESARRALARNAETDDPANARSDTQPEQPHGDR